MSAPLAYAAANRERFLKELEDLLRVPSVSADKTNHSADVRRAAEWLHDDLVRMGMQHTEMIEIPDHHPMVYSEWMGAGANAPTVLVYGHYDVQPAAMSDGWHTPPFEPTTIDGKLYARGAADDKGQMLAQLKAIESLLANGGSPNVNIKVLVEGEEETSSAGLLAYVPAHVDKLKADVCVISDTSILEMEQPSIVYSVRGIVYCQLDISGPDHDLHSGEFGGAVHNPLQVLTEILAGLHHPDGTVNIPGFYDDVLALSDDERQALKAVEMSEDKLKSLTGVSQSWGEPGYTITERIGGRPTLEINGIAGGFYGEGAKTVLPARGMAKISCRLVANQNPQKIWELLQARIQALTPPTVTVSMQLVGGLADAALVDIHHPTVAAAANAYEKGWGKRPVFQRGGGTLPIVAEFQRNLNAPVILLGFGLDTDGLHGPDEHFHLECYYRGIDTAIHFFQEIGALL